MSPGRKIKSFTSSVPEDFMKNLKSAMKPSIQGSNNDNDDWEQNEDNFVERSEKAKDLTNDAGFEAQKTSRHKNRHSRKRKKP